MWLPRTLRHQRAWDVREQHVRNQTASFTHRIAERSTSHSMLEETLVVQKSLQLCRLLYLLVEPVALKRQRHWNPLIIRLSW
jgi:hypothetical protein